MRQLLACRRSSSRRAASASVALRSAALKLAVGAATAALRVGNNAWGGAAFAEKKEAFFKDFPPKLANLAKLLAQLCRLQSASADVKHSFFATSTASHHQAPRNADEFGVFEFHAGPLATIVQ